MQEKFIGKVMLWFFVSLLTGMIFASCQYPFFIERHEGKWKIPNGIALEGNLLVIAALLVGVAVIQGQNLNRLLDIRRRVRKLTKLKPNGISANNNAVYDYLRIGFWLLSVDILVVLGLLFLAIMFGKELTNGQAFVLAAAWWSSLVLLVAGWICLAIVAGRSYKD